MLNQGSTIIYVGVDILISVGEDFIQPVRAHSSRVGLLMGSYMCYINRADLCDLYTTAGYFHDIGKLIVSKEVLYKKGKLSDEEFNEIKAHTIHGRELLTLLNMDSVIIECALYHHESLDGSGYPYGIKDLDIPFIARLCKVCDVFDALWEDRPYRKGLGVPEILYIMEGMVETNKVDPTIYHNFVNMIGDNHYVSEYLNRIDRNNYMPVGVHVLY